MREEFNLDNSDMAILDNQGRTGVEDIELGQLGSDIENNDVNGEIMRQ